MSQAETRHVAGHFEEHAQMRDAMNLGMWTFLASEILFFGGLFLAYTVFRNLYPEAFHNGSSHLNRTLGTINTFVLLLSSLMMALADHAVQREGRRLTMLCLGSVVALALTFLVIKGFEYHHEWTLGHVPGLKWTYEGPDSGQVQLFYVLYFTMTSLHAVHMIAGIIVLSALMIAVWRRKVSRHNPVPVEIAGLYWHFVDIVWLFLFPLLYLIGVHAP